MKPNLRTAGALALCALLSAAMQPLQAATLTVSPNTIGDDYTGVITLQIGGLNTGEAVLVERLTDVDGDGTPEASDVPMQIFPIADGQTAVIGGVTNLHTPSDLNSANGAITVNIYMGLLGFEQRAVGQHVYRVSSPTSRFSPVTSPLTITNVNYSGQVSGTVRCSGTNVPFAMVVAFAPEPDGDVEPRLVSASDASGNYTLKLPPGGYLLAAFKSNYVADFHALPMALLEDGGSSTATINLLGATRRISGRVGDANDATRGLGGLFTLAESSTEGADQVGVGFTDKDGNFSIGVTPGSWGVRPDEKGVAFLGYVALENGAAADCTSGNVSNLAVPTPKGQGLFYGTVTTEAGAPMAGVSIYGSEMEKGLEASPTTDASGRYFIPIVAGTNWQLSIEQAGNSGYPGYIYSQGLWNGTAANGVATIKNFIGKQAPYQISGYLRATDGTPLGEISVWGSATLNGIDYNTQGRTDANGFFTLLAATGRWTVGAACDGDEGLRIRGYSCNAQAEVTVANGNATVNVTATHCGGVTVTTGSVPNGEVNVDYGFMLQADSCGGGFTWSLRAGSGPLPPGITLQNNGLLSGRPSQGGTWTFTVQAADGTATGTRELTLTITGTSLPLNIDPLGLPGGTQGVGYSQTLTASGGTPPYAWAMSLGSGPLPAGLTLTANGILSGTPTTVEERSFRIQVTDAANATNEKLFTIRVLPPTTPLTITTSSLPDGKVGESYQGQLSASGGFQPYSWHLAMGSGPLPAGLGLNWQTGEITGVPTTAGTNYFIINLNDINSGGVEKTFSIIVAEGTFTPPALSTPTLSNGQFRFTIHGTQGTTYEVQASTDLATWGTVLTTNAPSSTFTIAVGTPGGPGTYYRLLKR